MGCNTNNDEYFGDPEKNCSRFTPPGGSGVPMKVVTYPNVPDGNWPDVDRNRVMYPSFLSQGAEPTRARCGKLKVQVPELSFYTKGGGSDPTYRVWEHVPSELSIHPIYGDQWFMIQYDTYDYFRGTPCKRFETIDRTDSWPDIFEDSEGPPDPETGEATTVTTQTQSAGESTSNQYKCIPCTGSEGQCRPSKSTITYSTPDGNLSGDSKNPYPTIWAVDTDSPYIVFKYNELTTTVPDAIDSLSLSHNTVNQVMWENESSVGEIQSSIGNWDQNDGNTTLYVVIDEDIQTGSVNTGDAGRITIRIRPIIEDYTNDVYTFSGSLIDIIDVANPGTGYSAGQSFTFNHTYLHESGASTTWNFTLTIDSVQDLEAPTGSTLALLQASDTINGHTVIRSLHTDIENFSYHVMHLDGAGSTFTKDTNYTSGRDHDIQVVAGYGIADRATLIGLYEFRNKNIQYVTKLLRPDVPHYYDDIEAPIISATVTNGKITGATIIDGGSGLNNLDKRELVVSPPQVKKGKQAKVKGTFSGGQLTNVKILDGGSGYSYGTFQGNDGQEYQFPTIAIADFDKHEDQTYYQSVVQEGNAVDSYIEEVENDAIFDEDGEKLADGIGKIARGSTEKLTKPRKTEGFDDIIKADTSTRVIDVYEVRFFRPKEFFVGEPDEELTIDIDGQVTTIGGKAAKGTKMKSCTRFTEYRYFEDGKSAKDFIKSLDKKKYKAKLTKYTDVYPKDYYQVLSDELEHEKKGRGFGKTFTDGTEVPYSKKDYEKIRKERYESLTDEVRVSIEDRPVYSKQRRADLVPRQKLNRETTDQFPRPKDVTKDIFEHITEDNQSTRIKNDYATAQKRQSLEGDVISSAQRYQNQLDSVDSFYIDEITHDEDRDEDNFYRIEDVEVRTVETSFQRLPCASRFRKYQIRQYVPDAKEKTSMSVTLRVDVPAIDPDCNTYCGGLGGVLPEGGEPLVDFEDVTITYAFNNADIYGGCEGFTANGEIDIFNDLTTSADLFTKACKKMGNPYDSICANQ